MNIKELCYELYKEDWKLLHGIIREQEKRNMIRYFEEQDTEGYSYEDYLDDYGYGRQLYVCFDEFLGAEFTDKEYMYKLLNGNTKLFDEYLKVISCHGAGSYACLNVCTNCR